MLECLIIEDELTNLNLTETTQLVCRANDTDLVIARDPDTAQRYLDSLAQGRELYLGFAGDLAGPTAIVTTNRAAARLEPVLNSAGYANVQAWFDAEEQSRLRRDGLRQVFRRNMPDASEAEIEASVQAEIEANPYRPMSEAHENATIAHETAHTWLRLEYSPRQSGYHYGSDLPDWVDEVVAVAVEFGPLVDRRLSHLASRWQDEGLPSLSVFLESEHPIHAGSRRLATPPPSPPASGQRRRTQVVTFNSTQLSAMQEGSLISNPDWYVLSSGFGAYLRATASPGVMKSVAEWMAEDGRFEDWLAMNGADWGLPGSIGELEASWEDWLTRSFGASGSEAEQTP